MYSLSGHAVIRRTYTPYGVELGTAPATWPGTRGSTGTTTGLTNLGAREYNPAAPAFISPDPVLVPYSPADLDPYDYAAGNPAAPLTPPGCGPPARPAPAPPKRPAPPPPIFPASPTGAPFGTLSAAS
jgi:RHS repeat-associated protein